LGPHLGRRQVSVLGRAQHRQHLLAFGLGEFVRRFWPRRRRPEHRWPASTQHRRAVRAEQLARLLRRRRLLQRRQRLGDHGFDLGSVSALSESFSKSACAFPVISNASFVRSNSASSRAFLARSFSSSISSRERRCLDLRARPSRAPASACLRHSEMCDVYRPSRRRIAPRSSDPFAWESYSARISALYSALNVRRVGFAAASMSSSI